MELPDICKFKWEEKDTDKFESDIEITDAEIERLKDLSNQWKN
nr:MAG TPA: hypothetical protein [Caudoviricetes sp.]